MENILKINIEDHLTTDEIKNIVWDEFKTSVARTFREETDLTRIIGNIAHEIVFDEVKKYIPEFKELLVENVRKIIEEKNFEWYMFRGRDVWDKEEGPGLTIIKETLNSNKEAIKKRIEDDINNFDIKALISDYLGKKMEEVADEFSKISDFLYEISSKQKITHEI